jgi:hypothetical protein
MLDKTKLAQFEQEKWQGIAAKLRNDGQLNNVMRSDGLPMDATGFFLRQLTAIEQNLNQWIYATLQGLKLFPVDSNYNVGTEYYIYRMIDHTGKAKVVSNGTIGDIPRVATKAQEVRGKIVSIVAGFGYTVQEIRAAAMAMINLDEQESYAAKTTIEQAVNQLVWLGDIDSGIYGILNHPGVPIGFVPADGTGLNTEFATKTPEQIYRDISNMINDMKTFTKGVETPDTVVLPIKQFSYINTTIYSNLMGYTILEFLRRNLPEIKRWEAAAELEGVGTGGSDVMLGFVTNPMKSKIVMPVPFEMFPPQLRNMEYTIDCHARCGAASVRYPLSINIKEGI